METIQNKKIKKTTDELDRCHREDTEQMAVSGSKSRGLENFGRGLRLAVNKQTLKEEEEEETQNFIAIPVFYACSA